MINDPQGNLIAETDSTGTLIRAYVYLNQTPVAQIDKAQATETMTYLYTDHLGTPRLGTNNQGKIVWKYDGDPYGTTLPNEDPARPKVPPPPQLQATSPPAPTASSRAKPSATASPKREPTISKAASRNKA